jgi:deoxyguanosine kinase
MPTQLVTIEGNIGSGKTTIARHIASKMPDTLFFPAPGRSSNPHWEAFHNSPKEHAAKAQTWFLLERLRVYTTALRHMKQTGQSAILDFSLWSDEAFAVSHYENGFMTAEELLTYQKLTRAIFSLKLPPPHLTIVLYAAPEVCLQRSQGFESKRPEGNAEDYLRRLEELLRERYVRDLDSVFTPRWLKTQRVAVGAPGLAPAPSLMTLVRDWSDLTKVKPTAIVDAIMCTEPIDFDAWYRAFEDGTAERAAALVEQQQC